MSHVTDHLTDHANEFTVDGQAPPPERRMRSDARSELGAVAIERVGDVTVVTPPAAAAAGRRSRPIWQSLSQRLTSCKLVWDLSGLSSLDRHALRAFLTCLNEHRRRAIEMCICELAPPLRAQFRLLRIHESVPVLDSKADAIRWFQLAPPSRDENAGLPDKGAGDRATTDRLSSADNSADKETQDDGDPGEMTESLMDPAHPSAAGG